jgi:fatty-acyl-CoA synthase
MHKMIKNDPFIRVFADDPADICDLGDIERIERIPESERFPCRSTWDALLERVRQTPDDVALTFLPYGSSHDQPRRWTYGEYLGEVTAAANMFCGLGLGETEAVLLLLPNVPEMLFAIWASEVTGIASPVNPFLEPAQIAAIAQEADARIMVTLAPDSAVDGAGELWAKAQAVKDLVPGLRAIVTVGGQTGSSLEWATALSSERSDALDFERVFTGSEVASYFHTGGTTGVPKLARRTHRGEVVNVCQMLMTGPRDEDFGEDRRVILCGLPLFHASAYVAGALNAIIQGAELVLAGPAGFRNKTLIEEFWALVERYRVTFFAVVPTVYAALLNQSSDGYDLSSLRLGGSGGAPLPVSILREFRARTGADIVEGYGMTECTATAMAHTYRGGRKLGSVGLRLPYLEARIVRLDDAGKVIRDCGVDEIGVILLKGPNVIPGYKQDEANLHAWPEPGWLNTGDLGRCDPDGYYWITGRAKDLIIRGGHNIDPAITEDSLVGHPAVKAVAAVSKPDAYAGELPIAYVVLNEGRSETQDDLVAYARQHCTERAAAPVEVITCQALPMTAVGKVFKPVLRKDAINRVYEAAASEVLGTDRVQAETVDDPVKGLRVILRIDRNGGESLDDVVSALTPALDPFTYKWDLVPNTGSDEDQRAPES